MGLMMMNIYYLLYFICSQECFHEANESSKIPDFDFEVGYNKALS